MTLSLRKIETGRPSKSTLLHLLAGLDNATSGSVRIGDQELGPLSDDALTRLRRDRVGFVFQSFNLIPTLTAAENIRLPLDLAGREPDQPWFDYVVKSVGIADRLSHRPSEMSGGQRQRVAIARALITCPEVAFADEPTGNLDSASGAEVLRLLRDAVTRAGQTVVMVTHDPIAAANADRVVLLADGAIRHDLAAPGLDTIIAAVSGSAGSRRRPREAHEAAQEGHGGRSLVVRAHGIPSGLLRASHWGASRAGEGGCRSQSAVSGRWHQATR